MMRQVTLPALAVLTTMGLLAVMSSPASAQSGTRRTQSSGSSNRMNSSAGSGQRTVSPGRASQAPLALEGYCPVSLQAMRKWVKGNPAIQTVFDGHTYYFANQQGKQMFSKDSAKYTPVLGGDCAVSLVKMGKRAPGNIRQASLHEGRLYLFANENGKKIFQADPRAYEDADLAYGGNCVVCSLNMKQTVTGKPELTVVHNGLRYLFPSADQRNEFVAHPQKYEVVATRAPTTSSGSRSRQSSGSGSSSR